MYEDILNQAKEICDTKVKEMYKNWTIKEFSPTHVYTYMYIAEAMKLLKEYKNKTL